MGLSSAAMMCQWTTDAVVNLFTKECYNCTNFLDDFGGAEVDKKAWQAFQYLGKILKDLGLIEKQSKAFSPAQSMEFWGILFNSVQMTMWVTSECLLEIRQLVANWLGRVSATIKQLESLIWKLLFVAKCVLSGRLLVATWCSKGVDRSEPYFCAEWRDLKRLSLVEFFGWSVQWSVYYSWYSMGSAWHSFDDWCLSRRSQRCQLGVQGILPFSLSAWNYKTAASHQSFRSYHPDCQSKTMGSPVNWPTFEG